MNTPFPKPDYFLAAQCLVDFLSEYNAKYPTETHLKFQLNHIYNILNDDRIEESPTHLKNILQTLDSQIMQMGITHSPSKLFNSYIIDNRLNLLYLEMNPDVMPYLFNGTLTKSINPKASKL